MELRQVEYVLGVVEHGGFTRAAEALHVTQPALSQGIARLEEELGVDLFHRVGRRVVVSSAGAAFMEPARQLLRDRTVLSTSVAAVAGLEAGRLDVVALPTLAVDPLATLVGAYRRAHPLIVVHIDQPEDAASVSTRVRSGQSEIGLAELPIEASGLVTEHLLDQELVVALPRSSRLPKRRLTIADLATTPLITTPPGTSMRRLIDTAFADAGLAPIIAVETEQREAILPLVRAEAGASILPRNVVEAGHDSGVRTARLSPAIRRAIGLIWRAGPLSPAARAFIDESVTEGRRPRSA